MGTAHQNAICKNYSYNSVNDRKVVNRQEFWGIDESMTIGDILIKRKAVLQDWLERL
jgi:hypothetical protein